MSILKKAFEGVAWLGLFKAISQTFSWVATIFVARILVPGDYGLMEMATILTGYVALFSEMGLGAAIIQREEVTDEELSSLFWFLVVWGFILAFLCIILAYPTAAIFNEKRILRVTQSVSLLFIIGSFLIVPLNILNRELRFKTIGFVDAASTIICCVMMVIIARLGGGVWTLIGGNILREFLKGILMFSLSSWRPKLCFDFRKVRPYLRFGANIAGANSLQYVCNKSDRFFGGRALGSNTLGQYSLAAQLSTIPTDKLISLISHVSFPVFSRYQKNHVDFNEFYLRLVNIIAFITFPMYIGGIFIADQLIPLILGPKWIPMIFPFKLFCIAQLIISITTHSATANIAQGRPHWGLYMSITNVLVLPFSFLIASNYGLNALAIPWVTIYPVLRFGFTWITLKKLGISVFQYLKSLLHPLLATASMVLILLLGKFLYFNNFNLSFIDLKYYLVFSVIIGAFSYSIYILAFQRPLLISFLNIRKE